MECVVCGFMTGFVLFLLLDRQNRSRIPTAFAVGAVFPSGLRQPSDQADGMCQAALVRRLGVSVLVSGGFDWSACSASSDFRSALA